MRRLTAAVLATAAAISITGVAASAADRAVRAEVVVAGKGDPLDVRRIRIVDGLHAGESYRLPAFAIQNQRVVRTAYRLVASVGVPQEERRPPRRWLRFVPAEVAIDAGQARAIGVRLELPDDAEPGVYAVGLGIRPGGPEAARLTFRIEPAESTRASLRQAVNLAKRAFPVLVGAALLVFLVRAARTSNASARY